MTLSLFYQVSAFSTWEKERHKIVFDPRYLLLNPKERKQVVVLVIFSELCISAALYIHMAVCAYV